VVTDLKEHTTSVKEHFSECRNNMVAYEVYIFCFWYVGDMELMNTTHLFCGFRHHRSF
jgi:hypothetical protein